MSERSFSKRRRSTPPSPSKTDAADNVHTSTIRRPPRKRGKRESPHGDRQEDGSTIRSLPGPPDQARSLPVEAGQSLSVPEPSVQTTSVQGVGSVLWQNGRPRLLETTSPATPRLSQPNPTTDTTTISDFDFLMPHINQMEAPGQESLAVPEPEFYSTIDDFVLESMRLSPVSFPPVRNPQPLLPYSRQPQHDPLEMSFGFSPQNSLSEMPTTVSMGFTYRTTRSSVEAASYSQQPQAHQYPASPFSLALQEAYPVPVGNLQGSQLQPSAFQTPTDSYSHVQQDHLSTAQVMPVGHPQSIDQPAHSELSSPQRALLVQPASLTQPLTSPTRARISAHQQGNPLTPAHHSNVFPQSAVDLSTGQQARIGFRQLAQASGSSAQQGSLQQQASVVRLHNGPAATHSLAAPIVAPQAFPPQQIPAPANTLRRQREPQQQHSAIIQQLTSTPPWLGLEDRPQPNPFPNTLTPIEPRTLSEHYLWTQLEFAQLTMVGTLTELVARTQNGQVELDVHDQQVRNVTVNLINVMSLWYLLRRDRGWPL